MRHKANEVTSARSASCCCCDIVDIKHSILLPSMRLLSGHVIVAAKHSTIAKICSCYIYNACVK